MQLPAADVPRTQFGSEGSEALPAAVTNAHAGPVVGCAKRQFDVGALKPVIVAPATAETAGSFNVQHLAVRRPQLPAGIAPSLDERPAWMRFEAEIGPPAAAILFVCKRLPYGRGRSFDDDVQLDNFGVLA